MKHKNIHLLAFILVGAGYTLFGMQEATLHAAPEQHKQQTLDYETPKKTTLINTSSFPLFFTWMGESAETAQRKLLNSRTKKSILHTGAQLVIEVPTQVLTLAQRPSSRAVNIAISESQNGVKKIILTEESSGIASNRMVNNTTNHQIFIQWGNEGFILVDPGKTHKSLGRLKRLKIIVSQGPIIQKKEMIASENNQVTLNVQATPDGDPIKVTFTQR